MCNPRRQLAAEEPHMLEALEQLDLRTSVPLNRARIAYKILKPSSKTRRFKSAKTRWLADTVLIYEHQAGSSGEKIRCRI